MNILLLGSTKDSAEKQNQVETQRVAKCVPEDKGVEEGLPED